MTPYRFAADVDPDPLFTPLSMAVGARMHITRPMAKKLIAELQHFVDTGKVKRNCR